MSFKPRFSYTVLPPVTPAKETVTGFPASIKGATIQQSGVIVRKPAILLKFLLGHIAFTLREILCFLTPFCQAPQNLKGPENFVKPGIQTAKICQLSCNYPN
ncbi:MAG: hypothetical protein LBS10_11485 [Gracilibacteraceae bacterium]|jgi:hypothetical protein|nr:hypothetical protein [Gracilibacteraceae bacterium]